jgi:FkbM family methyltransferase
MSLKTICEEAGLRFDKNNLISISDTIKHIKIDIGLSYNAIQSQSWLENESNLLIFGFEPNPSSIDTIKKQNYGSRCGRRGLESKWLNNNIFILPVALSDYNKTEMDFYVTSGDEGCSSLFEPNFNQLPSTHGLEKIIKVPVYKLSDFFELFPFDKFPIIEYIKVDAQGSDLAIIKGGGQYLQNHVIYITLEAESTQYFGSEDNNEISIKSYMASIGFEQIQHPNTSDPTFMNTKFKDIAPSIFIKQV